MPTLNASFWRDANRTPIVIDGITSFVSKTLAANNTTEVIPLFHITGTVEVRGLWGVVTTALGSNNTAAYWRLNDQSAQSDITLSTGTTLSSLAAGSTIVKKGLAAAALTALSNSQERVSEPTTLETTYFSPFVAVKKTAAVTDIEFVYTSSNTPTTGVISFFARWLPISADAAVTPI